MKVAGGALSADKRCWCLIEYFQKWGKWVASGAGTGVYLVDASSKGDRVSLKRMQSHEASKMLGPQVLPNSNKGTILNEQKVSAIEWGVKVRAGFFSRQETWQALYSNISAKLKYPMPVCTHTENEFKSIMYPSIKAALSKSETTINLSTPIRDGPITSRGIGVVSLYNQQGTTHLAMDVK